MMNHETPRRVILELLSDGNVHHKTDIVKAVSKYYLSGTKNHVGDILAQMIKNGGVLRPKKGYYKLNPYGFHDSPNTQNRNPNQTNLFDQ